MPYGSRANSFGQRLWDDGFITQLAGVCRNVLTYFETLTRKRVLDAIVKSLVPDGTLLLGGNATVF